MRNRLRLLAEILHFSRRSEQLLWAVHAAVLPQHKAGVLLADRMLAQDTLAAVEAPPPALASHPLGHALLPERVAWAGLRRTRMTGRRSSWDDEQGVILEYVEDLKATRPKQKVCREACPLWHSSERHHHYYVGVGPGPWAGSCASTSRRPA